MTRAALVAVAMVALVAACGGGGDGTDLSGGQSPTTAGRIDDYGGQGDHGDQGHHGDGAGGATCSPSGTSVTIVAESISFNKGCLAVPAGQPFSISLDNRDSGPHNLVVLESHAATEVLLRIEIFNGPRSVTAQGPALEAGTYAFHCEVHPQQMEGTFVVA